MSTEQHTLLEKNYNIRVSVKSEGRVYKGRTITWTTYTITGKDFMMAEKPIIDLYKMEDKGFNWSSPDDKVSLFVYPSTKLVVKLWDRNMVTDFEAFMTKLKKIPDVAPDVAKAPFDEAISMSLDSLKRKAKALAWASRIRENHISLQITLSQADRIKELYPELKKPLADNPPMMIIEVGGSAILYLYFYRFNTYEEVYSVMLNIEKKIFQQPEVARAPFDEAKGAWTNSRSFAGDEMVITPEEITFLSTYSHFKFRKSGFANYSFIWSNEPAFNGGSIILEWLGMKSEPKVYVNMYDSKLLWTWKAKIDKALKLYRSMPVVEPDVARAPFDENVPWQKVMAGQNWSTKEILVDTQDPRTAKFIKGLVSCFNMDKINQGNGFAYIPMGGFTDKDIEAVPVKKPLVVVRILPKNKLPFTRYVVSVYMHDIQSAAVIEGDYNRIYTAPDVAKAPFDEDAPDIVWKTHKIDTLVYSHSNITAAQAKLIIQKLGLEKSDIKDQYNSKGIRKAGVKGYITLVDNTSRTPDVWTVVVTSKAMEDAVERAAQNDVAKAPFDEAVAWRFSKDKGGYTKALTRNQIDYLSSITSFRWKEDTIDGFRVLRSSDGLLFLYVNLGYIVILTNDLRLFKESKVTVDFYLKQASSNPAPEVAKAPFDESRLNRILEKRNPNAQFMFPQDLSEAFCQKILLHEGIVTKSSEFIKDSGIPGVKVFKEVWNTDGYPEESPDVTLTVYRNEAGDMVCTEDESSLIKFFTKHGIVPQNASSGHSVCSIGFSEKEQKWYGWSHRAACGFGIGDKIFEVKFGDENTLFTEHGSVTIKDMAQAKIAAKAFANYVS